MDKNLTYQKARKIRATKLTDLFADQLLYEKSIGGAIKKTISLKTQAKIKGIKEKFDPLNIAKFLTFGSKLGPALYGKLAGRDPRDIQNFTGRYSPIRVGSYDGSKIVPLGEEEQEIQQTKDVGGINKQLVKIYKFLNQQKQFNKDIIQQIVKIQQQKSSAIPKEKQSIFGKLVNVMKYKNDNFSLVNKDTDDEYQGINNELLKIYNFLKRSHELDIKQREKERNFQEELTLESERRHKEFLKALQNITGKPTAVKEVNKEGGIFDMLKNALKSVFDFVNDKINSITKKIEELAGKVADWIQKLAMSKLFGAGGPAGWLTGLLSTPAFVAGSIATVLGGAVIALQLAEQKKKEQLGGKEAKDLAAQRQTEEILGAGDITGGGLGAEIMAAAEGKETTTDKIATATRKKQNTMAKLFEAEGYTVSGIGSEGEFIFKDEKGKSPPKKLYNEISKRASVIVDKGQTLEPTDVNSQLIINQYDNPLIVPPTDVYKSDYMTDEEASKAAFGVRPKGIPKKKPLSEKVARESRSDFAAGDPRRVDLPPDQAVFGVKPNGLTRRADLIPQSANENLNNLIKENVDSSLPEKPPEPPKPTINNIIQGQKSRQQDLAQLSEIAVHNDEPTFLRMIMDSTRVV